MHKLLKPVVTLLILAGLLGVAWAYLSRPDAGHEGRAWQRLQPPYDVNALIEYDGSVLAAGRDGVTRLKPQDGQVLPPLPGMPEMTYAKAMLVDRSHRLWIAQRTGLARFDGHSWLSIPLSANDAPGPASAMIERADGHILVGGERGLALVEGDRLRPLQLFDGRDETGVNALAEDGFGRLWVGLASPTDGGLLVHDGAGWREFGLEQGLVHASVNQIMIDASNHLHVATGFSGRGGSCQVDLADLSYKWQCITSADGLASDMVRLVYQDRHGQIWYGSEFRGAAIFDGSDVIQVGLKDGMAGTELKAMLEDEVGTVWLGCDKGLTRIPAAKSRLKGTR